MEVIKIIDHELMESLEYKGEYGCRYTCGMCKEINGYNDYSYCSKQGLNVFKGNNVCRGFEARIKNPSAVEFQFDSYLEFLGSEFYRPYSADTSIILERYWGNTGIEITSSGGWRSKSGWINRYKIYDKPYCRVFMPRCHVEYDGHKFDIDYRKYREMKTIQDGKIHFDIHTWKDKIKQKKSNKETFGEFEVIK